MNTFPAQAFAHFVAIFVSLNFLPAVRAEAPVQPAAATNEFVSFVSRLTHAGGGTFDISMPITGAPGIEDRVSNSFIGVATYAEDIDTDCPCYYELNGLATDADLIEGQHAFFTVSALIAFQTNFLAVNCGGVETIVPFALAYADVNASRVVNHNDKIQVRVNIGMPLSSANFRSDVNVDGKIDQQDGVAVRAYKGRSLPP